MPLMTPRQPAYRDKDGFQTDLIPGTVVKLKTLKRLIALRYAVEIEQIITGTARENKIPAPPGCVPTGGKIDEFFLWNWPYSALKDKYPNLYRPETDARIKRRMSNA